jgi:hypothetical protein
MTRTFSNFMRVVLVCICISFCGLLTVIRAENASEAANIRAMSYEEKLKLWNSFSEEKKEAIRKKARSMPEKKFRQLKNNFNKIQKFAPEEQKRVRNNFIRLRKFGPKQRRRVKENFKRFKKLPQERKQFYRKQFRRRPKPEMRPAFNENFRKPGQNKPRDSRMNMRQGPQQPGAKPMQRKFNNRGPGQFKRIEKPEKMRKDVPEHSKPGIRPRKFRENIMNRPLPPKQRIEENGQMKQRDNEFPRRPFIRQGMSDKPDRPIKPLRPIKQKFNPDLKNRPKKPLNNP